MSFNFRGSDAATTYDEMYDAPIYRYRSITEVPWSMFSQQPDQQVRIIVQPDADILPLDVLYIPRDHPDLLIGLHGAVAPEKQSKPVFQFLRSFRAKRKESLLFLSDSTLLQHEELRIGWMVGNHRQDLALQYAELIRSLLEATSGQRVLLAGHSAGGFAAIRIGARIPSSHAVSVNGQFSMDIHREWDVNRLHRLVFPDGTRDGMLATYADRLDLKQVLSDREPTSTFTWFSHPGDHLSFGKHPHFASLCEYLGLPEGGGVTNCGDAVFLSKYESPSPNLHSLPGTIIPFLCFSIGEDPQFDLGIPAHTLQ